MRAWLDSNLSGLVGVFLVLGVLLIISWGLYEQGRGIDCENGVPVGWTPESPEDQFSQTVTEECHERTLR
jgi:hypothetical protein